eukprot:GEMP01114694.1.p1 GENE.GEMP01114694.1~~GEMP01114694.1.p1  ORF type:complete len:138 (-),score=7.00 GEMP01114694.1:78-491(-)
MYLPVSAIRRAPRISTLCMWPFLRTSQNARLVDHELRAAIEPIRDCMFNTQARFEPVEGRALGAIEVRHGHARGVAQVMVGQGEESVPVVIYRPRYLQDAKKQCLHHMVYIWLKIIHIFYDLYVYIQYTQLKIFHIF